MTYVPEIRPKYQDPVQAVIYALPFISYERKKSMSLFWNEHRPEKTIFRALEWYEKHDQNVILLLRLCLTIAPIVLLRRGVSVEWVVAGVVLGIFGVEYLDRKRAALEKAKTQYEVKKAQDEELDRRVPRR